MGWQTQVAVQLLAGNSIINPNGFFVYSGTPASGNLIFSIAPATTTVDNFGNTVIGGGATSYAPGGAYSQLVDAELALFSPGAAGPATVVSGQAGEMTLSTGNAAAGDTPAVIELFSADANSGTSQVSVGAAELQFSGTTISAASATAIDFDIATIDVANGNVNLNMAAPPNAAAVIAGTATQAQYNACLGGMLNSMTNRKLFA